MAAEQGYIRAGTQVGVEDRESRVKNPKLWVELEIDREPDVDCPLAGLSRTNASGQVQLTGNRCNATFSYDDDQISVYSSTVEDSCTCTTVCGPGFSPVDLLIEDGSLVVRAYVDSRDHLTTVVETLRESEDEWRLRRLTTPERSRIADGNLAEQLFEDLTVTEKQREAVRAAVEMGYYAEPREASLSDLASRLGVSRSALSQRLNAVESKLIETLASEL